MARINFHAAIREMRDSVIKVMQERGITELTTCKSYQEWGQMQDYKPEDYKEDEEDDIDYLDYLSLDAPYIIVFDKYNAGYDYRVDKVLLKDGELKFDCYSDEAGSDTFSEHDRVDTLSVYNVYDALFDLLDIQDDSKCVWVFYAVQAVNDQPCDSKVEVFVTEEAALAYMREFVNGEDGELKFAEKQDWIIEVNTPDYFQAYKEGYYNGNHTEAKIEKFELKS